MSRPPTSAHALTEPPPGYFDGNPDAAPGPPKPAGLPGRWVVFGVVVGSLLITAGFWTVKAVRGNPGLLNKANVRFTDGLGALERIARLREGIRELSAKGDDAGVVKLQEREAAEWKLAEDVLEQSLSTGLAKPAAVGWLAEVKRRAGELTEAERLFDQALGDRPPPQALNAAELERDPAPDPADLGGRALTRAAQGNAAGAAADARRALELSADDAKTRANGVFAQFAADRATLERLAAGR